MSTFTPPSIEELQEKFDQYHVESFIAQGGMGAVYLAKQISLDRPVAIKILPQEFGDDADYQLSFETEAKAMAKLNHTNLVGIFDFGEVNGMLYIVMEYVPGRSLFDTANGQRVDEKEAARLIADMSEGLEHAHNAGLLHRDIKPANVLIDDEVRPKIVDFGLARPMSERQQGGIVFGTPGYTAPEVLSNPRAVDHRSDIFSMGVMLYELLTAQLPASPMIPASRVTHTDSRFDVIIARCVHPQPEMRYKTAGELGKALHDLIVKLEKTVSPLKPSPAFAPVGVMGKANPSFNNRVASSAGGGVKGLVIGMLIALIIGGGAYAVYSNQLEEPSQPKTTDNNAAALELKKKQEEENKRKELAKAREKKKREEKARRDALEEQRWEDEERRKAERESRQAQKEKNRIARERKKAEKEKQEKEEAARIAEEEERQKKEEAEREAKLKAFDLESFLEGVMNDVKPKFEERSEKTAIELDPIFKRMKRELSRTVRRYVKGRAGKRALNGVEEYVEEARRTNTIPKLPKGLPKEAKKKLESLLREYKSKTNSILKEHKDELRDLKRDYVRALENEKKRMSKLKNKKAVDLLKKELNKARKLEDFIDLLND